SEDLRRHPRDECAPKDKRAGGHRIHVQLAPPYGGLPLRRLHSFHVPALGFRSKRTHFDCSVRGSRTACCPLQGFIERWQFQNRESPKLLFSISIGAVLNVTFCLSDFDCGSSFRNLQRITSDINSSLDHRLVIGTPCARVHVAPIAVSRLESLR